MFKVSVPKGTQLKDYKRFMWETLGGHYGIVFSKIKFEPECGCQVIEFNFNDIPLEDLVCNCGKTFLIKYENNIENCKN